MSNFNKVDIELATNVTFDDKFSQVTKPLKNKKPVEHEFDLVDRSGETIYAHARFKGDSETGEWCDVLSFKVLAPPQAQTSSPGTSAVAWSYDTKAPVNKWKPNVIYKSDEPYSPSEVDEGDDSSVIINREGAYETLKRTNKEKFKFSNIRFPFSFVHPSETPFYNEACLLEGSNFNVEGTEKKLESSSSLTYQLKDLKINTGRVKKFDDHYLSTPQVITANKKQYEGLYYPESMGKDLTMLNEVVGIGSYDVLDIVKDTTNPGTIKTMTSSGVKGFTLASVYFNDHLRGYYKQLVSPFPVNRFNGETANRSAQPVKESLNDAILRDTAIFGIVPSQDELVAAFDSEQHKYLKDRYTPGKYFTSIKLTELPQYFTHGETYQFRLTGELPDSTISNPFVMVNIGVTDLPGDGNKIELGATGGTNTTVSPKKTMVSYRHGQDVTLSLKLTSPNPVNYFLLRISLFFYPTNDTSGQPNESQIRIVKIKVANPSLSFASPYQREVDYTVRIARQVDDSNCCKVEGKLNSGLDTNEGQGKKVRTTHLDLKSVLHPSGNVKGIMNSPLLTSVNGYFNDPVNVKRGNGFTLTTTIDTSEDTSVMTFNSPSNITGYQSTLPISIVRPIYSEITDDPSSVRVRKMTVNGVNTQSKMDTPVAGDRTQQGTGKLALIPSESPITIPNYIPSPTVSVVNDAAPIGVRSINSHKVLLQKQLVIVDGQMIHPLVTAHILD